MEDQRDKFQWILMPIVAMLRPEDRRRQRFQRLLSPTKEEEEEEEDDANKDDREEQAAQVLNETPASHGTAKYPAYTTTKDNNDQRHVSPPNL